MSAAYERSVAKLAKLAALATAPSATPNESETARRKFDAEVAKHGLRLTVEEFLAGHLRPVTHIKVNARGRREALFEGNSALGAGLSSTPKGWNPSLFKRAPCPHGCRALVYLVPKSGTKRTFVAVTDGRIERTSSSFGYVFDAVALEYHDDECPEIARRKREASQKHREQLQARRAAAAAAREAAIAADPKIAERELRHMRARRREREAFRRNDAEATRRAKAAADAATAAYWREVEAKAERTRRWREANPERARQLNREAQARWRDRQKLAKGATALAVKDRP